MKDWPAYDTNAFTLPEWPRRRPRGVFARASGPGTGWLWLAAIAVALALGGLLGL